MCRHLVGGRRRQGTTDLIVNGQLRSVTPLMASTLASDTHLVMPRRGLVLLGVGTWELALCAIFLIWQVVVEGMCAVARSSLLIVRVGK